MNSASNFEKFSCKGVSPITLKAVQEIIKINYALAGRQEARMLTLTDGTVLKTVYGPSETIESLAEAESERIALDEAFNNRGKVEIRLAGTAMLEVLRDALWQAVDAQLAK